MPVGALLLCSPPEGSAAPGYQRAGLLPGHPKGTFVAPRVSEAATGL